MSGNAQQAQAPQEPAARPAKSTKTAEAMVPTGGMVTAPAK